MNDANAGYRAQPMKVIMARAARRTFIGN